MTAMGLCFHIEQNLPIAAFYSRRIPTTAPNLPSTA